MTSQSLSGAPQPVVGHPSPSAGHPCGAPLFSAEGESARHLGAYCRKEA